jgi:hypothetical protein
MKTVRINSQNDMIDLITLALEEMSLGQGFKILCNIEYLKQENSTTMVFERKDGKELDPSDFFFLGYFVGRDFEEKACNVCNAKDARRMTLIEKIKPRKRR